MALSNTAASVDPLPSALIAPWVPLPLRTIQSKEHPIQAKVLVGGVYAALYSGSRVEVYSLETATRIYTLNFEYNKQSLPVQFLVDAPRANEGSVIIVGLLKGDKRSSIRVIDLESAATVTSFDLPFIVTVACPLWGKGPSTSALQKMRFPLAIGARGGHLLVVDLFRPQSSSVAATTEDVHSISLYDPNAFHHDKTPSHPYVDLLQRSQNRDFFDYTVTRGEADSAGSEEASLRLPSKGVQVTSISWGAESDLIAVGYNFGGFQLWDSRALQLLFSSDYIEDGIKHPTVTTLAFQTFVADSYVDHFLWIGRGTNNTTSTAHPESAAVTLVKIQRRGTAISAVLPKHHRGLLGSYKYGLIASISALKTGHAVIVWQNFDQIPTAVNDSSAAQQVHEFGCLIFDLARAQQESVASRYLFDTYSLSKAKLSSTKPILAAIPDFASVSSFEYTRMETADAPKNTTRPIAPSLSFDLLVLQEDTTSTISFQSAAEKVLGQINAMGPAAIDMPDAPLLNLLAQSGIIPIAKINAGLTNSQKREAVFDALLMHKMTALICDYILEPVRSSGGTADHSAGFLLSNPRVVLDWAWSRVVLLNQTVMQLRSSGAASAGIEARLTSIHGVFLDLYAIMSALHARSIGQGTPEGVQNLERKMNSLTIVTQHVEMQLWIAQNDTVITGYTASIADELSSVVNYRRLTRASQFNKNNYVVNAEMQRELVPVDSERAGLLLIDMLLNSLNAEADVLAPLIGAEPSPLYPSAADMDVDAEPPQRAAHEPIMLSCYPPTSVDGLLDLFLTPACADTPLKKRCIILYFLLDRAASLPQKDRSAWDLLAAKFCKQFLVPHSLYLLTRGLWLLDDAIPLLSDPSVSADWSTEILRILGDFGAKKEALMFFRAKQSQLTSDAGGPGDRNLRLTALILNTLMANNLLSEAFTFQRSVTRSSADTYDKEYLHLLYTIFSVCDQRGKIEELFDMPLDQLERDCLIKYLEKAQNYPKAMDCLIAFHIQRADYRAAIELHERISATVVPKTEADRTNAQIREHLIQNLRQVLPTAERKAIQSKVLATENRIPSASVLAVEPSLLATTPLREQTPQSTPRLVEKSLAAMPSPLKVISSPLKPSAKRVGFSSPSAAARALGSPSRNITKPVRSPLVNKGAITPSRPSALVTQLQASLNSPVHPKIQSPSVSSREDILRSQHEPSVVSFGFKANAPMSPSTPSRQVLQNAEQRRVVVSQPIPPPVDIVDIDSDEAEKESAVPEESMDVDDSNDASESDVSSVSRSETSSRGLPRAGKTITSFKLQPNTMSVEDIDEEEDEEEEAEEEEEDESSEARSSRSKEEEKSTVEKIAPESVDEDDADEKSQSQSNSEYRRRAKTRSRSHSALESEDEDDYIPSKSSKHSDEADEPSMVSSASTKERAPANELEFPHTLDAEPSHSMDALSHPTDLPPSMSLADTFSAPIVPGGDIEMGDADPLFDQEDANLELQADSFIGEQEPQPLTQLLDGALSEKPSAAESRDVGSDNDEDDDDAQSKKADESVIEEGDNGEDGNGNDDDDDNDDEEEEGDEAATPSQRTRRSARSRSSHAPIPSSATRHSARLEKRASLMTTPVTTPARDVAPSSTRPARAKPERKVVVPVASVTASSRKTRFTRSATNDDSFRSESALDTSFQRSASVSESRDEGDDDDELNNSSSSAVRRSARLNKAGSNNPMSFSARKGKK